MITLNISLLACDERLQEDSPSALSEPGRPSSRGFILRQYRYKSLAYRLFIAWPKCCSSLKTDMWLFIAVLVVAMLFLVLSTSRSNHLTAIRAIDGAFSYFPMGEQTVEVSPAYRPAGGKVKRPFLSNLAKKRVAAQQRWLCGQCGKMLDETFEVDHQVPLWAGGGNDGMNLKALCVPCHRQKTARENSR